MKSFQSVIILFFTLALGLALRLVYLTQVPPSLHGDELGVSYNAYSLLKTGRDEYAHTLPLTFRNDLTPFDVYLTTAWVSLLGLNEFSSRIHSVVIGMLTLIVSYVLITILFKRRLALLTMFIMAISPWHIHTSRIGLGVNSGLFLQIVAIIAFLQALRGRKFWLIWSFLSFGMSTYAYHAPKLTAPLLLLSLFFIYRKQINQKYPINLLGFLFFVFIILPSVLYLSVRPLRESRFGGVNVFITFNQNAPKRTIFQNRFVLTTRRIVQGYFSHFDFKLLFLDSRQLKYFQIPDVGMMHLWELPFFLFGGYFIASSFHNRRNQLVLAMLIIAPTAASLSLGVPFSHFNRVMLFLPIFPLFSAVGLSFVSRKILKLPRSFFQFLTSGMICLVIWSTGFYLNQYYKVLPGEFAEFWGVYLRQAIKDVVDDKKNYDHVIITNQSSPNSQSYIYLLFYGQKTPQWLQSASKERDKTIGYKFIDQYQFRPINWERDRLLTNALLVGTNEEIPSGKNVLKDITDSKGATVLKIARSDN